MQAHTSDRSTSGLGSSSLVVALLGREQPGDENLALRYLGAALKRAGHRARRRDKRGSRGVGCKLGQLVSSNAFTQRLPDWVLPAIGMSCLYRNHSNSSRSNWRSY